MPSEAEFKDLGKSSFWQDEISAGEKELQTFRDQGKRVIEKFLDKNSDPNRRRDNLNLFHSNVVTMRAMLYGQTPKVDVGRRYQDANDDVGRVAAEILERCLNNDIQFSDETFSEALRACLDDFLLPGLGQAKVRYEPVIMDGEIASESAPVDYIHWQDFCWSPGCRAWPEVWWVSFKTYITKEEAKEKWGKIAERMNYVAKTKRDERDNPSDQHLYAEVYEIWCKKNRCLYWFSKGVDRLLGKQSDPLKLREFWPCPRPMLANTTTSTLVPKADYIFAQDLYIQIDTLSTRLAMLAKAVKVVGVYDKSSSAVQRMLNEATENELIPVDNWAMFAEKGGLKGQVDWLPIEEIVKVMQTLAQVREQCIQLLYQVTGMSDILRGATDPRETKGAQELKSKYASIRIQAMQDLFAKFASDIQKIKAEIMVKHYQINSIITQSNIAFTPDAQYAQGAVALIKDPKNMIWRIQIRPESVAMVDYAQLKQERTEFLMASSQFMQSAAPLAQLDKSVTPTLLELLKWGLSGFKGAQQIEGALDKAIAQATEAMSKPPPPPPPDPKVEAAKIKAQTDQQLAQQEFQQKQMEFQQQMQQDQQKFQQEMIQMQKEFELKMRQAEMEIGIRREEAQLKAREQYVDAALNIEQQRETTEIQNTANREQHDMKMEQMRQKPKTNGGSG